MRLITYHLSKYSKITTRQDLCSSNDDEKALCSEKRKDGKMIFADVLVD